VEAILPTVMGSVFLPLTMVMVAMMEVEFGMEHWKGMFLPVVR
jgi:hypothetical protein